MEIHTFIICAYKESPYLERCIQSCVSQSSVESKKSCVALYTSTNNEYIDQLAKKYAISIYTKLGGSIGKDWNNALSFVKTKYATIAHQDDIYLSDYGEKILNVFQKKEDINLVVTDYLENDANDNVRNRNINLKIKTFGLHLMSLLPFKGYQRRIYAFGNFISCPTVSYNLERLSEFKFNETLKMTLDWDAWERIMKIPGKIKYISDRLVYHRIHSESETTVNTEDRTREKEELEMYQRYWGKKVANFWMRLYIYNQRTNHDQK